MTAIITRKNAKDKACINSNGTGGDYPKDAVFDSIKAQTIDCDTMKVNKEATFTVDNEQIPFANHESQINALEQSGSGGDSSLAFSSGYPEIVITNNLTETSENNVHTLIINIDKNIYESYIGDLLEFVLLADFKITDKVIISKQSGWKFTCPIIEYTDGNSTLSSINEQEIHSFKFIQY